MSYFILSSSPTRRYVVIAKGAQSLAQFVSFNLPFSEERNDSLAAREYYERIADPQADVFECMSYETYKSLEHVPYQEIDRDILRTNNSVRLSSYDSKLSVESPVEYIPNYKMYCVLLFGNQQDICEKQLLDYNYNPIAHITAAFVRERDYKSALKRIREIFVTYAPDILGAWIVGDGTRYLLDVS